MHLAPSRYIVQNPRVGGNYLNGVAYLNFLNHLPQSNDGHRAEGGRTESILMSLPPLVRWEYQYQPKAGTNFQFYLLFFMSTIFFRFKVKSSKRIIFFPPLKQSRRERATISVVSPWSLCGV
jgi:hypothetical protein